MLCIEKEWISIVCLEMNLYSLAPVKVWHRKCKSYKKASTPTSCGVPIQTNQPPSSSKSMMPTCQRGTGVQPWRSSKPPSASPFQSPFLLCLRPSWLIFTRAFVATDEFKLPVGPGVYTQNAAWPVRRTGPTDPPGPPPPLLRFPPPPSPPTPPTSPPLLLLLLLLSLPGFLSLCFPVAATWPRQV